MKLLRDIQQGQAADQGGGRAREIGTRQRGQYRSRECLMATPAQFPRGQFFLSARDPVETSAYGHDVTAFAVSPSVPFRNTYRIQHGDGHHGTVRGRKVADFWGDFHAGSLEREALPAGLVDTVLGDGPA